MYGNNINNQRNTYLKLVKNEPEEPVLASLVERCLNQEDWGGKEKVQRTWKDRLKVAIDSVVDINPYLADVEEGQEIPAVDAVAWVKGSRGGFDCRPKLYDGVSKTWKLCDTGSMVTCKENSK